MMVWNAVFSVIWIWRLKKKNIAVKKTHKIKNNLLCDEGQYVHYLSPTVIGTVHDKKIATEYPILLPLGSVLRQDTGFIGHDPLGIIIERPFKKTIGHELSFSQLIYN